MSWCVKYTLCIQNCVGTNTIWTRDEQKKLDIVRQLLSCYTLVKFYEWNQLTEHNNWTSRKIVFFFFFWLCHFRLTFSPIWNFMRIVFTNMKGQRANKVPNNIPDDMIYFMAVVIPPGSHSNWMIFQVKTNIKSICLATSISVDAIGNVQILH